MDSYPSNSHKNKMHEESLEEDPKKIDKVIEAKEKELLTV